MVMVAFVSAILTGLESSDLERFPPGQRSKVPEALVMLVTSVAGFAEPIRGHSGMLPSASNLRTKTSHP